MTARCIVLADDSAVIVHPRTRPGHHCSWMHCPGCGPSGSFFIFFLPPSRSEPTGVWPSVPGSVSLFLGGCRRRTRGGRSTRGLASERSRCSPSARPEILKKIRPPMPPLADRLRAPSAWAEIKKKGGPALGAPLYAADESCPDVCSKHYPGTAMTI